MKILLSSYYIDLSGSSTYIFTLALRLNKQGHQVDIFSFVIDSMMVKKLKYKNINVVLDIELIKYKKYDFIITQHSIPSMIIRTYFPNIPLIYISHGILPFLEQPPSVDINIQRYIAVSEEVKNNLISNYKIPPKKIAIIRNFIDVKRFCPQRKIQKNPHSLLFISYRYNKKVLDIIQKACRKLKIKLQILGKNKFGFNNRIFNIEDHINKSDIVISTGRGALEGMACGRVVIIFDYRGGDGLVTEKTVKEMERDNFCGTILKKIHNLKDITREIKKYEQPIGEVNRKIILKDYNVEKIASDILKICYEAQKNFKPKKIILPTKELRWQNKRLQHFTDTASKKWAMQKTRYINSASKLSKSVK